MASKKRPAAVMPPSRRKASSDVAFAAGMNRRYAAPVGQQGAKTARKKAVEQVNEARGRNASKKPLGGGQSGSKADQRKAGSRQVQKAQVENQRGKPANKDVYYDGGAMSGAIARKQAKQARDSKTRKVSGGKMMS